MHLLLNLNFLLILMIREMTEMPEQYLDVDSSEKIYQMSGA
jgi:hypothetical protein